MTGLALLMQSHVEEKVRFGRVGYGRKLVGRGGEVAVILFLWVGLQDECCQQLWQL